MVEHEFLWADLETTGLVNETEGGCFGNGHILEWAAALAADDKEGDCRVIRQWSGVIHVPESELVMDDFVRDMHTRSGLLADVEVSPITLEESDAFLADLCESGLGVKPRSVTLAGNSVWFDALWFQRFMPKFAKFLHHRVFDVSTLQRSHQTLLGTEPVRAPAHRALDDVHASLAAYKAWREQAKL
jgi:oligoribonuclease